MTLSRTPSQLNSQESASATSTPIARDDQLTSVVADRALAPSRSFSILDAGPLWLVAITGQTQTLYPADMQHPIITLTTDFGADSPYVAQMKGVIYSINPDVRIVDVTHSIPPQDIRRGAWVWRDVMSAFPSDTIHIGVVDPGVGSDRQILCLQFDSGIYVGPDNGLVSYVAAERRLLAAVSITNRRFMRPQVSHTFHGRDIMAPAAARLSLGTPMDDLANRKPSL